MKECKLHIIFCASHYRLPTRLRSYIHTSIKNPERGHHTKLQSLNGPRFSLPFGNLLGVVRGLTDHLVDTAADLVAHTGLALAIETLLFVVLVDVAGHAANSSITRGAMTSALPPRQRTSAGGSGDCCLLSADDEILTGRARPHAQLARLQRHRDRCYPC